MSYKIDFSVATSHQIEATLCKRLESIRLSRNITQTQLAEEAGVSPRTIGRLEKGQGVSMDTFIRIMMALSIAAKPRDSIAGSDCEAPSNGSAWAPESVSAHALLNLLMNPQLGRGMTERTIMNK